ncbi:hypothetical protein GCM10027578_16950 [Spirosoma luteolum]
MPKSFTDQQIYDGLRTKDVRLIDTITCFLYSQCQRSITHMVVSNSGNSADADDLFQRVILDFLKNTWDGTYQPQQDVRVTTYIYGIAHRRWLKELRQRNRTVRREIVYTDQSITGQSHYSSPEQDIIQHEEDRWALTIFSQLCPLCQQLLEGFYRDKKTMRQLAAELQLRNEENTKTRKYRCMLRLKQLMNK